MSSSMKPTHLSAMERLQSFLQGKKVTNLRSEVHETADQTVTAVTATIDPMLEEISPLSSEDKAGFLRNVGIADQFILKFAGLCASGSTRLDDLDASFAGWIESEDKEGYTPQAVEALIGAAFGQYCIDTLDMEWVQVKDSFGASFAVVGKTIDVRSYPFDMVAKRIASEEIGFMAGVYMVLKNRCQAGEYAQRGA
jgi:Domain of unknown function (DUF3806)